MQRISGAGRPASTTEDVIGRDVRETRPGRSSRTILTRVAISLALAGIAAGQETATFKLTEMPGQAPLGMIEIHGVSAGAFNPALWQSNQLHWVPDVRRPLLAPRMSGVFRNIYAPSAMEEGSGWRFFYSAWDGIESGNDRVYSSTTPDFIDFYDRRTIIHNGDFVHVSNINVQKREDGTLHAVATCWPAQKQTNKPIYFFSADGGKTWNGASPTYRAQRKDIVKMHGYDKYETGDLNGANVLLRDHGKWMLYFTNWGDHGKLYWSEGAEPNSFKLGGLSLETEHAVNDVKKFTAGGKDWFVMALHKKGDVGLTAKDCDKLWYSLSNEGKVFGKEQRIPGARGEDDRFIFAVGFVTRSDRILGVLYGAGASERCERNRIFGYWLQKRVLLTADRDYSRGNGEEVEAEGALGPDRQWFRLPQGAAMQAATLTVFAEDGSTPLGTVSVNLKPGTVYRIDWR